MILFQVMTPWTLIEQAEGLFVEPALASAYKLVSWSDITGQLAENLLPEPNLYIIQAQADQETFAAISADPSYQVLWSKIIAD